ncbi:tellurite resistance TerB family protein [Oceanithermus sp.]|uniref:tellurite resistance TerB family protein n=1 Tax=Oceanithermus sp. TaxID=2268145 RepID=UPI00257BA923|nr:tellurite resistance TerB family protein [Oceanithermus sp.]
MGGFSDVLGALLESQLSGGAAEKLKRGLQGGGLERMLGQALGDGGSGALGGLLGGSGGAAGMLGQLLGGSGGRAGAGGLEALAGRLLGGGSASPRDLGGGLMSLLGGLAMAAMTQGGRRPARAPLGLRAPETPDEEAELESAAQVVLMAMINAAKADGRIDPQEAERIVGQLDRQGADPEVRDFVFREMAGPLDTGPMVAAARGNPELALQVYAASLLAVEVDTAAENRYLDELQRALELPPQAVEQVERSIKA